MIGAHLGRLGGVIARPRATFDRLLSGQGSLWEVFFWMVIVTAAIAPTRAGRAVLIGRGSLVDGALAFVTMMSSRMMVPLVGTLAAAGVLWLWAKRHETTPPCEVLLDATAVCLVPFLLLAALGALLHHAGLELWFMPHRSLNGRSWPFWVRGAVAFAWSIGLYCVLALRLRFYGRDEA